MNKLLVVEDEEFTSDLLRRYFEIVGYEVVRALNGKDAVDLAAALQPDVIILDIMLPDMDGYEICRKLRLDERTNRIPILFLTQKHERRDRLDGLSLGADDYITKPFDIEELRLRVHNILTRLGATPLVDARTSLPNMEQIKLRLPLLLEDPQTIFMDVQIVGLDDFGTRYGPVARNQVVRSVAKLIGDVLHEIDPKGSFIGHPRDDHFLIGFNRQHAARMAEELTGRFGRQVSKFYDYEDQNRGGMKLGDKLVPFMSFKLLRIKTEALRALTTVTGERKTMTNPPSAAPPARSEG